MHAAISLLSVLLLMAMTLPPPVPAPSKDRQPIQHETTEETQRTEPSDQPTDHPIPSLLQPQPPQTTPRADTEPKQPSEPSATNGWMVFFTGALVFVTA